MNNYDQDCQYTEIVETVEDYVFGSYVQCTIPTVMALLDTSYKTTSKINTKNIMNKNKDILGITSYKPSAYISVFIPKEYANIDDVKKYIDTKCNDIKNYIDDKCETLSTEINTKYNEAINHTNTEVSRLDGEISTLKGQISGLQNQVSSLQPSTQSMKAKLRAMPKSTDDIYSDIDFLSAGKKGDKYIISFIGGDINSCQVIGRYNGE